MAPDPAAHYGTLPNGMRYVLMRNQLPPGAISMNFVFDFGSAYEAENERGLAHFIEHMAFNGSTHLEESEIMKVFERLGMRLGADTNAMTSFANTVYLLNLNQATEASVDESLFFLRELSSELTFDAGAIERERGVVLSEWRQSQSPRQFATEAVDRAQSPGTRRSERSPIGLPEVIQTAPRERLVSLYERYYRPERATLVIAGDFDVASMEAKIASRFASWAGKGAAGSEADLDRDYTPPVRPVTAAFYANPQITDQVLVDGWTRPAIRGDTLAKRRESVLTELALSALSRRLFVQSARENAPFIDSQTYAMSTSIDTLGVTLITRPGGVPVALAALEKEWRRAAQFGPTADELERGLAEVRRQRKQRVELGTARPTSYLASAIGGALMDDQVFTTPEADLALFEAVAAEVTLAQVHAETRRRLQGESPVIFAGLSAAPPPGYEAELVRIWQESAKVAVTAPEARPPITFAYTDFGAAGKVVADARMEGVGARLVSFANDVRLTVKPTQLTKGAVYALVRIGHGGLDMSPDAVGLGSLAGSLHEGGLQKHSYADLVQMFAGRSIAPVFGARVSYWGGGYSTTADDLLPQLQLAAAFTTAPGFRPEGEQKWRQMVQHEAEQTHLGAMEVWYFRVSRMLASGDKRYGVGPDDGIERRSYAEVAPLAAAALGRGPVEITIVGDVDEQRAIDAVAQTFGALPQRDPPVERVRHAVPVVFRKDTSPIVLAHQGEPVQSLAAIAWPVGVDPDRDPRGSKVVQLLSAVMARKAFDQLREALGVSYSPSIRAELSETEPGFNHIEALANVKPSDVPVTLAVLRDIAAQVRAGEISDDELTRVVKPQLDALANEASDPLYYLYGLESAHSRPAATKRYFAPGPAAELRGITKDDLVAAANAWLRDESAQEVRILPEATSAAGVAKNRAPAVALQRARGAAERTHAPEPRQPTARDPHMRSRARGTWSDDAARQLGAVVRLGS